MTELEKTDAALKTALDPNDIKSLQEYRNSLTSPSGIGQNVLQQGVQKVSEPAEALIRAGGGDPGMIKHAVGSAADTVGRFATTMSGTPAAYALGHQPLEEYAKMIGLDERQPKSAWAALAGNETLRQHPILRGATAVAAELASPWTGAAAMIPELNYAGKAAGKIGRSIYNGAFGASEGTLAKRARNAIASATAEGTVADASDAYAKAQKVLADMYKEGVSSWSSQGLADELAKREGAMVAKKTALEIAAKPGYVPSSLESAVDPMRVHVNAYDILTNANKAGERVGSASVPEETIKDAREALSDALMNTKSNPEEYAKLADSFSYPKNFEVERAVKQALYGEAHRGARSTLGPEGVGKITDELIAKNNSYRDDMVAELKKATGPYLDPKAMASDNYLMRRQQYNIAAKKTGLPVEMIEGAHEGTFPSFSPSQQEVDSELLRRASEDKPGDIPEQMAISPYRASRGVQRQTGMSDRDMLNIQEGLNKRFEGQALSPENAAVVRSKIMADVRNPNRQGGISPSENTFMAYGGETQNALKNEIGRAVDAAIGQPGAYEKQVTELENAKLVREMAEKESSPSTARLASLATSLPIYTAAGAGKQGAMYAARQAGPIAGIMPGVRTKVGLAMGSPWVQLPAVATENAIRSVLFRNNIYKTQEQKDEELQKTLRGE